MATQPFKFYARHITKLNFYPSFLRSLPLSHNAFCEIRDTVKRYIPSMTLTRHLYLIILTLTDPLVTKLCTIVNKLIRVRSRQFSFSSAYFDHIYLKDSHREVVIER